MKWCYKDAQVYLGHVQALDNLKCSGYEHKVVLLKIKVNNKQFNIHTLLAVWEDSNKPNRVKTYPGQRNGMAKQVTCLDKTMGQQLGQKYTNKPALGTSQYENSHLQKMQIQILTTDNVRR